MASFYDCTIGEQVEFHRVISSAGLTDDDVRRVIKDRSLADDLVKAVRGGFVKPGSTPFWYEKTPSEQLDAIKYLNGVRGWGFTDADFPSAPEEAQLGLNEVLSLAVYLPKKGRQSGLQRTVEELWGAIPEKIGDFTKWRWDGLKTDSKHLRLAPHTDGSERDWKPGIRWVVIDLTAGLGKSPRTVLATTDVDDPYQPTGVELLSLLLLQPNWATSWDGKKFFYPNLTGLQFYYNEGWSRVPFLYRSDDDRQFELYAAGDDYTGGKWASPAFREC